MAVREDDRLVEIHVEHTANKAVAGSVYKGRVARVLPGMQSAFVNIGLKRDAFLYVTDVIDSAESLGGETAVKPIAARPVEVAAAAESGQDSAQQGSSAEGGAGTVSRSRRKRRRRRRRRRKKVDPPKVRATSEEDPPAKPAPPTPDPESEAPASVVLPGESIAKYDPAGAQGQPSEEPTASPPSADEADGSAEPEMSDSAPSRSSAEVAAPSMVSEFRLSLKRLLKRKPKQPAPAASQGRSDAAGKAPASTGEPAGSKSGRPAKRARRTAGGKSARPARRQPHRGGRAKPSRAFRGKRRPAKGKPPGRGAGKPRSSQRHSKPEAPQANIKDLLKKGQEVIVQVTKEPVGTKGARITSHVSLPGSHMVYLATAKHDGVARKIHPEAERGRLRKLVKEQGAGKPGGFIVRTAAKGVSDEVLRAEMKFLSELWASIQDKAKRRNAPALLHCDLDIVDRVLREHLGRKFDRIWVDSEEVYQRVAQFLDRFQPDLAGNVKLWTRAKPILTEYGISKEVDKALKPKVWLKSGGYLVINQTEALVAIDVNTGRYVGDSDRLEDTILATNLEAAEEIVRQLRLRDLGGIIVLDFIDMDDPANRKRVHQTLHSALRKTRSPSRVLPFNEFGMVVITRKPVRRSLERSLCEPCPACSGAGTVKSATTMLSQIFAEANRIAAIRRGRRSGRGKQLILRVRPDVAKQFQGKSNSQLQRLERTAGTAVMVRSDPAMKSDSFSLS